MPFINPRCRSVCHERHFGVAVQCLRNEGHDGEHRFWVSWTDDAEFKNLSFRKLERA